jgi:hypothetical protein
MPRPRKKSTKPKDPSTGMSPDERLTMPAGERARLALGLLRGDRECWNCMVAIGHKLQRHAAYSVK